MEITRGKIPCAKKVVIYGPEGIGKSTFASQFPEPVFIDTEGSTNSMDVARLPKPTSWQMLLDEIQYIKSHPDVCKTLVIDTIDWAESMCIQCICDKHQKSGIEDFGYGNGYVYTKEEMGRFLNRLSEVVEAGVNVVLTAHAQIRKFEQPDELGAYDRWELKLGKKTSSQTSPLIKEWADMLLFANYKTFSIAVDDKGQKRKAQGGERVMYTSHHACWDAKNRYGLSEQVPFSFSSIAHIIDNKPAEQPKWQMIALERQVEAAKAVAKSKTAWRIEGTLREFPKFEPVNLWFDYPVHRIDQIGSLRDLQLEAEKPMWEKAAQKRKENAQKTRERKLNEFEIAFQNIEFDGREISAAELAEALDTNSRELLSWLGETKRQKKELRRKFEKYMGDDGKAYIRRKGAQD